MKHDALGYGIGKYVGGYGMSVDYFENRIEIGILGSGDG
jgi:hypothetical protein